MTAADWVLGAGLVLSLGLVLALHRRQAALERQVRRRGRPEAETPPSTALQRVGLVRYRAYNDVGGDHSFALALLDANGDGVVVNGIYHRERCRVYAKPIRHWTSGQPLTEEESAAVRKSQAGDQAVDMGADRL